MSHIPTDDRRGLAAVEHKHGPRITRVFTNSGARWIALMQSMGGPFHIDQLIVINPGLTHKQCMAAITYVNESELPLFIRRTRFAKAWRWVITPCNGLDKYKLRAEAALHARKSSGRVYHTESIECTIDEL